MIVGIGASAGGLSPIEAFFDGMPNNTGMAFIVVQHLSPDFKSLMSELLARHTQMTIYPVTDGMVVEPDSIYLIPSGVDMTLAGGQLLLTVQATPRGFNLPIDIFFRSLAADAEQRAIAIVLSGTGRDGSQGVKDVHAAGGIVLAQDPQSAAFSEMPITTAQTGIAQATLPPEQFARYVAASAQKQP